MTPRFDYGQHSLPQEAHREVYYTEPQSVPPLVGAEYQCSCSPCIVPSAVSQDHNLQPVSTHVELSGLAKYTRATAAVIILFVELEVGIAFLTFALSSVERRVAAPMTRGQRIELMNDKADDKS